MVAFPRLERSVYHLINQPKIYRAGELMISQVTTIPGPAPHTKGALPLSPLIKKAEFFSLSCKKGFGIVKHVYLVVEALNFMSRGLRQRRRHSPRWCRWLPLSAKDTVINCQGKSIIQEAVVDVGDSATVLDGKPSYGPNDSALGMGGSRRTSPSPK